MTELTKEPGPEFIPELEEFRVHSGPDGDMMHGAYRYDAWGLKRNGMQRPLWSDPLPYMLNFDSYG